MHRPASSSPRRPPGYRLRGCSPMRASGGPPLRAMTFHERASRSKRLPSGCWISRTSFTRCRIARARRKPIPGSISTAASARSSRSRARARVNCRTVTCISMVRRRGSVERGHLRGPARLCAARRRGGAYQCVQFPGVGDARKTCARDTRRRAGHRQAGDGDGVSRGARRAPDHRVGHFARGRTAARVRKLGQSVRPSDVSGLRLLHRLRAHGRAAPCASEDRSARRTVRRGDRFAEFEHSRRMPRRARPNSTSSSRRSSAR